MSQPQLFPTAPRFDGATFDVERDSDRLHGLLDRVRIFMGGGEWRTLAEIADACRGTEASVSARLRDLRKQKFGAHTVERRYVGNGVFAYRLMEATQ
jgi:hypothetical protein